jgi:SAM-dependent methyltransferase
VQKRVSGTEGYAEEAAALLKQYESIRFEDAHRQVAHLYPAPSGRVLDIGSGTGRDAAGFAVLGHRVVAVEPTAALRTAAMALHPSPNIEWLDDSLPNLASVIRRNETFDLVMLSAVWMHLDEAQRRRAMPNVACLVKDGGVMMLSLRHGPVPPGRRMFDVSAAETIELAQLGGLRATVKYENQDALLGRPAVSWTWLAFAKRHSARC